MLDEAYFALHTLEEHHWWYVGARSVYKTLLELGFGKPRGNLRMLEVGCGSGGNLSLLGEYGPTIGVEVSATPLKLVRPSSNGGLVQARAEALPFLAGSFDGVHLLGVIEHLEADEAALREAVRVCRPQGAVTLLTSAHPILWSHHDTANLHKRRYLLGSLRGLLHRSGLSITRLSYQNFFTFLPTLMVRLLQRRSVSQAFYDMGAPPRWLNAFLIFLLKLEASIIRYLPLPVGVDLVAVCRPEEEN